MEEGKKVSTGLWFILVIMVLFFVVALLREGVFDDYLGIDRDSRKWSVNGVVSGKERFDVVYVQKRGSEKIKIIRDKETGASYLFVQDGDGAGVVDMNFKLEVLNDIVKMIIKK